MKTRLDRAEQLQTEGRRLLNVGDVYTGYGCLVRATVLLLEARLELERRMLEDLVCQALRVRTAKPSTPPPRFLDEALNSGDGTYRP